MPSVIIERFCAENGIELLYNADMSAFTTFRVGGAAEMLALPQSGEAFAALAEYCRKNSVDFTVLGKGSNVLVSDDGIDGLVIVTAKAESIELVGEDEIICSAGTPLIRLCSFALEHSLTGLEFAYGIPGTAGGAAFMNAGAYGGEMKNVITSCEHIDLNGSRGSLKGGELCFGYRHSAYVDNGFTVISIRLKLKKGDGAQIKAKMDDLLGRRKAKQPLDFPSAGSTFKRPEGFFAGALIEQCSLKGFSVGGAQVSEKHAGFVINRGGATAKDILKLVETVKETVLKETGVELEPEIRFIGKK